MAEPGKKVGNAFKSNEERYKKLSDLTFEGIIIHDNGIIQDVNQAIINMSGYSYSELIGMNIISELFVNESYSNIQDLFNKNNKETVELLFKKKNGEPFPIELETGYIEYKGEPVCVSAIRDITNKKKAKSELRKLSTAIEQSPGSILITDLKGVIEYVNPAFTDITYYLPDEIIGKNINILKSGYHSKVFYKNMWDTILSGKVWKGEVLNKKKNNELYWEKTTIAPIFDDSGQITNFLTIKEDITELKNAENALSESERKYRLLAENVADVIWETDSEFNIIYISPSSAKVLGYSPEEMQKDSIRGFFTKSSFNQIQQYVKKTNEKKPKNLNEKWETLFTRKNGDLIWIESRTKILREKNRKFKGIIGVSRDITDRKLSEIAIKQSEEKFRSFFEHSNAIMLLINNKTGKIEDANLTAQSFYGYNKKQFTGLTISDIIEEPDLFTIDDLEKATHADTSRISSRHKLKNREIRDVEIFPTLVESADNSYFFTIIQNITKRKKAIQALKNSELKKLAILKLIPDLIFVFDKGGTFLEIYTDNPKTLLVAPEKYPGRKMKEIFPAEICKKYYHFLNKAFETRQIQLFEYSIIKNNETYYEEARLIVSNENELLAIVRDITIAKKTEFELKRAWEEAEEANRAKSIFLANISHEIRTPINAVLGFTDILENEVTETRQRYYLESIKSSGTTLLNLINDLLDLSKIEAGKINIKNDPVNLNSVLEEIQQLFSLKTKEKKLDFIVKISDKLPDYLLLDELRITQIFINLIGNAIKFTERGQIRINCYPSVFKIYKQNKVIDLVIEVHDTGIGIEEDNQIQIFEAFKQQDEQDTRKYGGTGLGLTITKKIVEILGGKITVKSNPNKGSAFIVKLENVIISKENESTGKIIKKKIRTTNMKEKKILVVDDIDTNRKLLCGIFDKTDAKIFEADDGAKAFKLTIKHQPDLILLDLRMPVMDGFRYAEKIRNNPKLKHIPVIAISATALSANEKEKAKLFNLFIQKPVNISEIYNEALIMLQVEPIKKIKSKKEKLPEIKIAKEYLDSIPEIIQEIDNNLMKEWKNVINTSSFKEIEDFASHLNTFSKKYRIDTITEYSNKLESFVSSFDIDKIKLTLHDFLLLIKEIKKLNKK